MTFKKALIFMLAIYVANWIAFKLGFYGVWANLDIPFHYIGGFATGMLGIAVHHAMVDKHHFKMTPFFYHVLFIAGFTVLIAVAWEFHEYIIDNTIGRGLPPSQLSLGDTMLDLLMGLLGGITSAFVYRKQL